MRYRLASEVDLARHVRDVGFWHLPYGTLLGGGTGGGHKHTRVESSSVHVSSVTDASRTIADLQTVDWKTLSDKVQNGSPTEKERALQEIEGHFAHFKASHETITSKITEERTSLSISASRSPLDRAAIKAKMKLKESSAAGKSKEFSGEVARHTFSHVLTSNLINLGTKVLGAFASMLTGVEAAHFSEQFRAIAENPAVDSVIAVAATSVVYGLFNLVRKKLAAKRALRIAQAQGRVPVKSSRSRTLHKVNQAMAKAEAFGTVTS